MSVIVKGVKMPTTCTMCWLNTFCGVWNTEPVKHKGFNERLENCPLTELIRCKECKFSKAYYHGSESNLGMFTYLCTQGLYGMNADDYCSRAERKEE